MLRKVQKKSLDCFQSTFNSAQNSSFPQKSYQFSALKSAQKSFSTLKSTKKGAQKSSFPPKKVLKIVL